MATVIKRKNSPYWYMKFQIGGKQYLLSTKETDRKKAKNILEKTFLDMRRLHQDEKLTEKIFEAYNGKPRKKLAIEEVWGIWRKSPKRREPAPTTLRDYEILWNRFADWAQGKRLEYVHQVTPELAKEFMRAVWKRGVTANRYNKYRNLLRMVWRNVSDRAGIAENPWDRVETLSHVTRSKRELREEELKIVIQRVHGNRGVFARSLLTHDHSFP